MSQVRPPAPRSVEPVGIDDERPGLLERFLYSLEGSRPVIQKLLGTQAG
jgi:hypothetical protein